MQARRTFVARRSDKAVRMAAGTCANRIASSGVSLSTSSQPSNCGLPRPSLGYPIHGPQRQIVRLERLERPGLSEKEFFGLFAKCEVCGLIVARQVFHYHGCSPRPIGEDSLELTDCEE
jgi:hypothetical protein